MAETYRVLLYSHDSQGLGHVRRNLTIAHNLTRRLPGVIDADVAGLLVTGLALTPHSPLSEGFDWIIILGVSKGRDGYRPRSLPGATDDLIKLRSWLLQAVLLGFKFDLVIIDYHIYGVWSELWEPLMWLREQHPTVRVVLGLREVLDDPRVAAAEWERLGDPDRPCDLVDEARVYGDSVVHDPVATGEAPPVLADHIRFTGYLVNDCRVSDHGEPIEPKPLVSTTAGGRSDGRRLLRAAVAMRVPAGYENIVVTGSQLDDVSFEAIIAWAAPGTQVHRSWPGLGSQIVEVAAAISTGGYNTVYEILATDTLVLVIPRETPRPEQLIRAEAFRDTRALGAMRTPQITAETLKAWVADAATHRVDCSHISRDGLAVTADFAADLLSDVNLVVQEVVA